MANLDEKTHKLLIEEWLPGVRDLKRQRRPIFWIMLCVILVPLALAIGLLLSRILGKTEIDLATGAICALLLGVSSIAFVYLGRLQRCNDIISIIELAVFVGDKDNIFVSVSNVSCFGKMQGLIKDMAPIIKGISHGRN
jgi:hypothetical protein